ncbi:MAG: DegQ family serine endoprotease [Pseudomonadota bacterium]
MSRVARFVIPAFVAAAAFVAGCGISSTEATAGSPPAARAPVVSGLPDFTGLVEQNKASVVSISAEAAARTGLRGSLQGQLPEEVPEMFRRFFGDQFNFEIPPQKRERESLGSGFIISADGYILSNNHVVDGADRVTVRLLDRRELEARVVGTDKRSDIALLKVEAKDLPVVRIGKSEDLRVGEWVFAIGAPFGFDYSVTAGIVSALGRGLPRENYVPFIQTDVAINPGNSGGPLFNLSGEVVGINSQIFSGSGGYMGLSFAIPMDIAMEVVAQLKGGGKVSRGWLGVSIQDVDRDLAESFGLKKPEGALVAKVIPGTPAEAAGLKEGDIITGFEGKDIVFSSDLPHLVGRVKPGTGATLTVVRDGKVRSMKVKVGELPSEEQLAGEEGAGGGSDPAAPANAGGRLGLVVDAIPPAKLQQLGLGGGVVITRVTGSPAADSELRPGDIILAIGGKPVNDVAAFNAVVAKLPAGRMVPLLVTRGGNPRYVPIQPK